MTSSTASKPPPLKDRRVLVAVEQPQSQRFLLDLCRSLGIVETAVVQTADQALSRLDYAPFDILICAWTRMLDAPDLTRRIRKHITHDVKRTRIIILRAEATGADVIAVRDSGADEFIAMPLSQGSFQSALQRVATTPQYFVEGSKYKGPSRRRRKLAWENERRQAEASGQVAQSKEDGLDP